MRVEESCTNPELAQAGQISGARNFLARLAEFRACSAHRPSNQQHSQNQSFFFVLIFYSLGTMWSNNDDYSESGEPVKLYIPAKGPPRKSNTAPLESHIGGHACIDQDEEAPPKCGTCQSSMFLLVQLRLKGKSEDRFLCVYGCPRADCFEKITFENGFASGGQGVLCCQRRQKAVVIPEKPSVPVAPVKSSWYDDNDDDDNDGDNDWATGNADISNLENAVAAMEANLEDGALAKPKENHPVKEKEEKKQSSESFDCYLLNEQDEPPAPRQQIEEDDVGLSASDDKIRNMLARYMAEEEDEDILAALRGTDIGGGGGAGGEADERLSDEDRILLGFQDRLRRIPRQVVRYARGGTPLWSIPSETKKKGAFWTVPQCSCGAKRTFEFQLLPSLLHILDVDKFSGKDNGSGISSMLSSGMNWGSVAVFTCPNACKESEEAVVIQESVDENGENEGQTHMDFSPAIAVVEDMDDDGDFKPDV